MKLFPKLALSISTLLIGVLAIVSLSIYWTEQRRIRQETRLEQQAALGNLVHIAKEAFITNDDLLLVKYTRWMRQWNPAMTSASVVNLQGDVLAHSEPTRIGQMVESIDPSTSETLVLSAPVKFGTTWNATASIAFSQVQIERLVQARLQDLRGRLLNIAGGSLLGGIVLSFFLALSWARPIKQLAAVAEKIGKGTWPVVLGALPQRKDEFGWLAQCVQEMAVQLHQVDRMKEDFVSAVTHELRSPLGAIESYLNVIAEEIHEGISADIWVGYIERLRINTQRLTHFVNNLLDVSALERGKVKLEKQAFDLVALANDVVSLFALKLKEKEQSYQVSAPDHLGLVLGDPEKIRQVLVNLVSNAIKFTAQGGCIHIRVERTASGGEQRISVSDTGVGIAEADQSKIFNKFEQVPSARQTRRGPKGTGLGLAISKALIETHGQTLSLQSRLGEGSTFSFVLPLIARG